MYRLILGIAFLYFISCNSHITTTPEVGLNSILKKCVSNDTTVSYKLDTIIDFPWDRMVILTPYFLRENLKKCGLSEELPRSDLDVTEAPVEYLFIKDGKVLKHLVYDDSYSKIMLTFDPHFNYNFATNPVCGIVNTPNTYIKRIRNADKSWTGKTFLIFQKS